MISAADREFVAGFATTMQCAAAIGETSGLAHMPMAVCTCELARLVAIAQMLLLDAPVEATP